MKTILKAAAAAVLISAAVSAHAEGPHGNGYGYGYAYAYGHANGHGHGHGHAGRPMVQPVVVHHPLAGLREINMRQEEQRVRIDRGVRHGMITHREFRRLMAEQHDIGALERVFVADGFLAPHERAELHRRLDIASQHIFTEAHDHQRRF